MTRESALRGDATGYDWHMAHTPGRARTTLPTLVKSDAVSLERGCVVCAALWLPTTVSLRCLRRVCIGRDGRDERAQGFTCNASAIQPQPGRCAYLESDAWFIRTDRKLTAGGS